MQLYPDRLGALVDAWPNVHVLFEGIPLQKLNHNPFDRLHVWEWVHEHDLARGAQPLQVLGDLQRVELPLVGVPVGANPFEGCRAVQERVRHDAHLRIGQRPEVTLQIGGDPVVLVSGALRHGARLYQT